MGVLRLNMKVCKAAYTKKGSGQLTLFTSLSIIEGLAEENPCCCENVDELHKNAPEHFRQQRSRVSLTEKYLSQQIEAGLQFKNHILAGS